ncbi:Endonuclease/exonuclease/phosphatase [Schizophyllum fasciatum]
MRFHLVLVASFLGLLFRTSPSASLRVGSFNLRFDSQPDDIDVATTLSALGDPLQEPAYLANVSEQPWSTRRVWAAELLLHRGVEVFGVQEALIRQVKDLKGLLGSGWDLVGVGRDDGKEAGEYSAIFFYNSTLELLDFDSFWTSETPFEPSKYEDAGHNRICTVAHFQPKDGSKLTVFNTHLDDQSEDQRRLAASLIFYRARYEAVKTDGPVLVMGDFNSPPTGDHSGAYNISIGTLDPKAINETFADKYAVDDDQQPDFILFDLRGETERRRVSGNFATFQGFTSPEETDKWGRIDFIFGGSNGHWWVSYQGVSKTSSTERSRKSEAYHVDSSLTDDGLYISDHRPVCVDVSLD